LPTKPTHVFSEALAVEALGLFTASESSALCNLNLRLRLTEPLTVTLRLTEPLTVTLRLYKLLSSFCIFATKQ
jgi:hypothetical protein